MRIVAKAGFLATFLFGCVTAPAANILLNGDFQAGTLAPWTTFTTSSNGTNGSGLPDVVSFDTTGSGASLAAHFDVGEVTFSGLPEGGGITQMFTLGSGGAFTFFANIGSETDAGGGINTDAGTFSILIDGVTLASDSLGSFSSQGQVILGTLSSSVSLGAGPHTFEALITRDFQAAGAATPDEYVDNVSLSASTASTPEPSTFGLVALALIALQFHRQRLGRV